MNIIIKTTNIQIDESLKQWVEMRLKKLEKLEKSLKEKDVEIFVEIGKTTKGQRKGEIFRAEAQIRLPGKSIRVESVTNDLRKSVNETLLL